MTFKTALAFSALVLGFSGGRAFAEGDYAPFPFAAPAQETSGVVLVSDTGQAWYPAFNQAHALPSALAELDSGYGSETIVQTAASMPVGAWDDTTAYARSHRRNLDALPVHTARNGVARQNG